MRLTASAAAASAGILLIGGCASTPPPTAELASAHALVAQAEQSDASRYDSADLAMAQEKLRQADVNAKDDAPVATRLAQEASVDAQLALARTRANKEQDALTQVNATLQALQSETAQPPPLQVTPPVAPAPQ
jgi:uncharacterized protein DUF4398